jgi:hypothetical protein
VLVIAQPAHAHDDLATPHPIPVADLQLSSPLVTKIARPSRRIFDDA